MKKMLIALTALAFCGVAVASSGPLFRYVGNTTAEFAPQKKGHGGPGNQSPAFASADTGINSNGFVYVTFKDDVGIDSAGAYEYYTFTANEAANWVCSTGGSGKGKHQAVGSWTTTSKTGRTSYASFTVGNNGTVTGGAAIPPAPEPTTACSGTWELGAVTYSFPTSLAYVGLWNTTLHYSANGVMTGSCTVGSQCSKVFIGGVPTP